jgi:hypothetical protein
VAHPGSGVLFLHGIDEFRAIAKSLPAVSPCRLDRSACQQMLRQGSRLGQSERRYADFQTTQAGRTTQTDRRPNRCDVAAMASAGLGLAPATTRTRKYITFIFLSLINGIDFLRRFGECCDCWVVDDIGATLT